MGLHRSDLPQEVLAILEKGAVIPAHPLALDASRRFDRRRQRVLTRYYIDAGAGGLAVGVHTTQFAIREAGLYESVLAAAVEDSRAWTQRPLVLIAGVCGRTTQAVSEARAAVRHGYHAGLLSLAALQDEEESALIAHCRAVAEEMPLVGFDLQLSVGGISLDARCCRRFAEIDNVVAIKVAPFNRYRTLDVVRGVVEAHAEQRISLYTGNDDHIVLDLVTPFTIMRDGTAITARFRGGLLGHWSVWVRSAVELLAHVKQQAGSGTVSESLLALDSRVTDCNAAFFDVANDFHGCIAGCHEVLRRQGLLDGIWCLDPAESLSLGQREAIDRVCSIHADLSDDGFVRANLDRWLA